MVKNFFPAYRKLILAGALLSFFVITEAQPGPSVRTSVNRNKILLGEQLELTISYQFQGGATNISQPFVPDTFPHFEVIERRKADSAINDKTIKISQVILITSFDSGHWTIPAFTLMAGKKAYRSDTLGIDVNTIPIEGTEYNDIRDIVEVEKTPVNWKRWIAIGLSAILVLVLIWYFLKNRTKKPAVPDEFDSKLTPLEQAIQELKKLRNEKLQEKGEMKALYSRGYDILRVYLFRRYAMKVMQGTTDDILLNLQGKFPEPGSFSRVAEVLRISDAVKFAKYNSSAEEAMRSIDTLEKTIEELNQQKT